MGKKKHKINKISEQEYLSYIAGLKNDAALFNSNGDMAIPEPFVKRDGEKEKKQGD